APIETPFSTARNSVTLPNPCHHIADSDSLGLIMPQAISLSLTPDENRSNKCCWLATYHAIPRNTIILIADATTSLMKVIPFMRNTAIAPHKSANPSAALDWESSTPTINIAIYVKSLERPIALIAASQKHNPMETPAYNPSRLEFP